MFKDKKLTIRKKLSISQREFFIDEFEKGKMLKKDLDLMETIFFV